MIKKRSLSFIARYTCQPFVVVALFEIAGMQKAARRCGGAAGFGGDGPAALARFSNKPRGQRILLQFFAA
jgi:hypothetical protein